MPYEPRSCPACLRCGAQASERRLWPVYLSRPYTRPDGKRTSSRISCRICRQCVGELVTMNSAYAHGAPVDLLVRSRQRPRQRTAAGTWASREQIAAGSFAAAGRDR